MKKMIRVLLIEPHKYPRLVEFEHTLENLQVLVGGHIGASFPWSDPVAIVFDDDGKFKEGNEANRMLEDYDLLVGRFFICGIDTDDFTSISDDLALKYANKFWMPEAFLRAPEGLFVLHDDNGTKPGRDFLEKVDSIIDLKGVFDHAESFS